jgi:DNA-binding transcriptional LysR family regulator
LIADLVAAGAGAAVLPETAIPSRLDGVQVVQIARMPPRRLGLVNLRDAYLSIADRAVRDTALRLLRERSAPGARRQRGRGARRA